MSTQNNTFGDPSATFGNLNGFFKEVYADKLKDLIPDGVKLLNRFSFGKSEPQLGNLFHQPVVLGLEHGMTFAGPTEDAFNLLPAVASSVKDAEVRGNPKVLTSHIGRTAISRSQAGKAAFEQATKYVIGNALRSFTKKLEIELLYGQMGYGTVASVSTTDITITTAEWAPLIWAGAENLPVEIRNSSGSTSRGEFSVSNVDMDGRVITLNASAAAAGVVAGDVVWHKGAYGKEFAGIHKILTTTTGSLFNISVDQYNLFQGNSFSCGSGALSFAKMTLAAVRAIEKGQEGKMLAVCSLRGWANMMNDQAALRKYDGSYSKKKAENGMETLVFYHQGGEIEIMPSGYCKEGYAYLLSEDEWTRVGSSDVEFDNPNGSGQYLRQLENSAAWCFRLWTDQALLCVAPGRQVILTNIVNATT